MNCLVVPYMELGSDPMWVVEQQDSRNCLARTWSWHPTALVRRWKARSKPWRSELTFHLCMPTHYLFGSTWNVLLLFTGNNLYYLPGALRCEYWRTHYFGKPFHARESGFGSHCVFYDIGFYTSPFSMSCFTHISWEGVNSVIFKCLIYLICWSRIWWN